MMLVAQRKEIVAYYYVLSKLNCSVVVFLHTCLPTLIFSSSAWLFDIILTNFGLLKHSMIFYPVTRSWFFSHLFFKVFFKNSANTDQTTGSKVYNIFVLSFWPRFVEKIAACAMFAGTIWLFVWYFLSFLQRIWLVMSLNLHTLWSFSVFHFYSPRLCTRQNPVIQKWISRVLDQILKIPTVKFMKKGYFIRIFQFQSEKVNIEWHGRLRTKYSKKTFFTPFVYMVWISRILIGWARKM